LRAAGTTNTHRRVYLRPLNGGYIMVILLRRTAVLAALIAIAVGVAGCFGQEPAQRQAFIAFLQKRIIDKPGLHIPIMSDQDVANFGPYADQYRIMNGFHHRLNAAISGDLARAVQIGNPHSLEDLVVHRGFISVMNKSMTKMKGEVDAALSETDAAHAALKQPADLKAVYDAAYDHMVTKPGNVFRELIPMMLSGLQKIEELAAFLDDHRNVVEYRGGIPTSRDASLRQQLAELIQGAVKASEISELIKRKLRAMAEGH
jgi:hypothetical protein